MKPRILMALPQMPQDPSSGAARTAQTACEMAEQAGFAVRSLSTTSTERGSRADPLAYLQSMGLDVHVTPPSNKNRREFRFTQRGIHYTLLDTGRSPVTGWEASYGRQYDLLFDQELETFSPDIVFTYGGLPGDIRFFARIAEELGRREPKIAILAIESRGTAGMVAEAGLLGGFDLRRHESIMIAGAVPKPRDIFQNARALLVPSVWEEPSGRVVAEALVNGIPPLVSDRGGLSESCNGAGFVLPLPPDLTVRTRKPVPPEAVEPWVDVIVKLAFDEAFYAQSVAAARLASGIYLREQLAPRYVAFFESVLDVPLK